MSHMKRGILITLGLVSALASLLACAPSNAAPSATLTVYAAASLTNAFQEIGAEFVKANPGVKVDFNFAGSQELRTQIEQGAKADVFASADLKNMDGIRDKGLVGTTPQVFARNRLVVIVPKDNRAGIQAIRDLTRPGIKLIVADKSVPVGNYALQMLDRISADARYSASFKETVLKNVVSQENNVKAVLSKISLGEGDAGVVYSTDAQMATDKVISIDVPDPFNVLALYPIAVVKDSQNAALAQKWIAFVLSEQGQMILGKYGFARPA